MFIDFHVNGALAVYKLQMIVDSVYDHTGYITQVLDLNEYA